MEPTRGKAMKTKNVLQVVGRMTFGGVETSLMNIVRNTDNNKYHFVFLCYFDGEFAFDDEIRALGHTIVHIRDTRTKNPSRFIREIIRIIRKYKIDVVHSHVDMSSSYAMIAAKIAKVPIRIAHSHNTTFNFAMKLLGKLPINLCANRFVACGKDAGRAMFYKHNVYTVIPNGIDMKKFAFNELTRKRIRKDLDVKERETLILNVGRLMPQKNQSFLLDVFASYYGLDPHSKLLIVGDGELLGTLAKKTAELGLTDHVIFAGTRSDTDKIYSAADLFIMTSSYEGLPVVSTEAQINGLPCIFSDAITKESNLTDTVIFYPLSKSPAEWAEKIVEVKTGRHTENYEKLVKSTYNIKNSIKAIELLYAGDK